MAWDRRLLASSQHLTLLISGFHGLYPVLQSDASYTPTAQRLGVCLNFKVGLSARYKPGTVQVREVIRKHGLIAKDAEDEFKTQEQLAAQQAKLHEWGSDQEDNQDPAPVVEEVIDPDCFDRFSLSSSLESLMDQSFLKLVQIRRKFGLGWAGAELLHAENEKTQMSEADVLAARLTVSGPILERRKTHCICQEIGQADREESRLSNLPYDPLLRLKPDEPLNLPLTAFCYLIRRLSVCHYHSYCHEQTHIFDNSFAPGTAPFVITNSNPTSKRSSLMFAILNCVHINTTPSTVDPRSR
jgi:ubiquitin-conjugating enzyme E2 Q